LGASGEKFSPYEMHFLCAFPAPSRLCGEKMAVLYEALLKDKEGYVL